MVDQGLEQEIKNKIADAMGWDKSSVDAWYVRPNRNFEDMSPEMMVKEGLGKNLVAAIETVKGRG